MAALQRLWAILPRRSSLCALVGASLVLCRGAGEAAMLTLCPTGQVSIGGVCYPVIEFGWTGGLSAEKFPWSHAPNWPGHRGPAAPGTTPGASPGALSGKPDAVILRPCPEGQVSIGGVCYPVIEFGWTGGFQEWFSTGGGHSGPSVPSAPGNNPPGGPNGGPPIFISGNGYDFLYEKGSERQGFGLYSYALLTPSDPEGVKAMLGAIFTLTGSGGGGGGGLADVNVIYIPLLKDPTRGAVGAAGANEAVARYNFDLARALIHTICKTRSVWGSVPSCRGGLSGGPYLFTYASPLGDGSKLSPPLLFVDLTGYPGGTFPTIVDAYEAQVKRDDFTDRKKIDSFYITVLWAIETAKTLFTPVGSALGGVYRVVLPETPENGNAK